MKVFTLTLLLISSSLTFAFQEGTYSCRVDSLTVSTLKIQSLQLGSNTQVPYVELVYYKAGITHNIKGIATIDIQTTEKRDRTTGERVINTKELLSIQGDSSPIITFDSNNEVSENCQKNN